MTSTANSVGMEAEGRNAPKDRALGGVREAVVAAINSTPLREPFFGFGTVGETVNPAILSDIADAVLRSLGGVEQPGGLGAFASLIPTEGHEAAVVGDDELIADIDVAIGDSLDEGWLTRDGARAVVSMFKDYGWSVIRTPGPDTASPAASPLDILIDDALAKMKPFCKACQAIPKHGYCNMQGCPMPRPQQPADGRLTPETDANHQDSGDTASPAEQGGEKPPINEGDA